MKPLYNEIYETQLEDVYEFINSTPSADICYDVEWHIWDRILAKIAEPRSIITVMLYEATGLAVKGIEDSFYD